MGSCQASSLWQGIIGGYGTNTKTQSTQRRGISLCALCLGVNAVSDGKTAGQSRISPTCIHRIIPGDNSALSDP
jgi:hypothetical protein